MNVFEPLTVADYLLSGVIVAAAVCACLGLLWLAAGVVADSLTYLLR